MEAGEAVELRLPGVEAERRDGETVYRVPRERLRELVEALRDAGYDMLLDVSGVDEPKEARIRVVYHFTSTARPGEVVTVETWAPRDEPRVPSIHDIYPAAALQEREEHEMLGIVFEGNPDLRRLLLPEDWPEGVYPLRKDYRVPDEPWMSPRPARLGVEALRRWEEEGGGGQRGG